MRANFHTHTTFCDGKQTPEEIVCTAVEQGLSAIGLSGHGYTPFDLRYCMQDTEGYIAEVKRIKEKYRDKIDVLLGVEEDCFAPVDRERFEYIIGSCHYVCIDGVYYPIDSSYDHFKRCLDVFDGDILRLAETYFTTFVDYIRRRKPDIVGHFDVITKFDQVDVARFSCSNEYAALARRYAALAAQSGCVFEVNTGPVWRGFRATPLPNAEVLFELKRLDVPVILSSDSHSVDTLDFAAEEMRAYLKDIGFRYTVTLTRDGFAREEL